MRVDEILLLGANMNSIKKIDKYLGEKELNDNEFGLAITHLANILFDLHDVGYAFSILNKYLNLTTNNYNKALAYDKMIYFNYAQNKLDNVLSLIEDKKQYTKEEDYVKDLINYYSVSGNKNSLIKTINKYLSYEITDEERLYALKLLVKTYLDKRDIYNFGEKNNSLLSLAKKLNIREYVLLATYYDAYKKEENGLYDEALEILNNLLELKLNTDLYAKVVILILNILVNRKEEYHKATIFEAKYSEYLEMFSNENKKEYYELCISLYEKLNNNYNVQIYKNKINELKLEEKEEQTLNYTPVKIKYTFTFFDRFEEKQEIKEESKQEIFIKEIKKEEIKEEKKEEVKILKFSLDKKQDAILNLDFLFQELNKKHTNLREYIRLFFTYLNQIIDFKEVYILLDNKQYYFKKERLYSKNEDLDNTLINKSFNQLKDYPISDSKETEYKSVLKKQLYKDLDSYILLSLSLKHGAILFNLNKYISDEDINYYVLKIACDYLDAYFNLDNINNKIRNQYLSIDKLLDEVCIGTITKKDNYLLLNDKLAKLLNCDKELFISDYLLYLENEYVQNYNNEHEQYIYRFKNINYFIKEITLKMDEKEIKLLFKDKEINLADYQKDDNTKLYNKAYLSQYYNLVLKDETYSCALILIDNIDTYLSIYGLDFQTDIDKAMGIYLNKFDKYKMTYFKLDNFKYFLIIDEKDRRTIKNILTELLAFLETKIHELNHRVELNLKASFLRTNMLNTNEINEVIKSLYFAIGDEKVAVFDKNKYKDKMFEESLVTHISESIDENLLKLNYKQVVDYQNKNIKYLLCNLNLSNYNVEPNLIYDVIQKRNILDLVERYMIHRGLFEIAEIKDKKKYYLPFIFKVSKTTLLSADFYNYVVEQANFFKVPLQAINLYYGDDIDQDTLNVINKLKAKHVKISTNNLELLKYLEIDLLFYKNENINDYLIDFINEYCKNKNTDLVIYNINLEEEVSKYAKLGIKYYEGNLFKRILELKDLLK